MSSKYFSNDDEVFIRDNYKAMSNVEIASCIGHGVTCVNVAKWLNQNKLYRRGHVTNKPKNLFSESDTEFIKKNYDTMTARQIACTLGFGIKQVESKVRYLKLNNKRAKNNLEYFAQIDTPTKAYFLGFIFADGYVIYSEDKRSCEFGMELQERDKYILDILNDELGGDNAIEYRPPCNEMIKGQLYSVQGRYRIRVRSKKIVEDLIKVGIVKRKTQSTIYPVVSDELFYDFFAWIY